MKVKNMLKNKTRRRIVVLNRLEHQTFKPLPFGTDKVINTLKRRINDAEIAISTGNIYTKKPRNKQEA